MTPQSARDRLAELAADWKPLAHLREDGEACEFGASAIDALKHLVEAVRVVHDTFNRDDLQGYRTKDKRFAIDVLGRAIQAAEDALNGK